jgi:hypothetical protein
LKEIETPITKPSITYLIAKPPITNLDSKPQNPQIENPNCPWRNSVQKEKKNEEEEQRNEEEGEEDQKLKKNRFLQTIVAHLVLQLK